MRHSKSLFALSFVIGCAAAELAQATPTPEPKLIVLLSIDQFGSGLFNQSRTHFTGGLKRLTEEGVVFPNGYQSHASTETCPGHSTLLTGRHPTATGIIGNYWFKAGEKIEKVYCVVDSTTTVPGRPKDPRGPENLRVNTLGDWLKKANPDSRVVSISGKDRAAIAMVGESADAVFWWDDELGFNTYVPAGGNATERLAPVKDLNAQIDAAWRKGPPAWTPAEATCKRLNGEHSYGNFTVTHQIPPPLKLTEGAELRKDPAFKSWFRASPIIDRLTLELAKSLIERNQLGKRSATDLLAISLSGTDYIGHRYGNQGPEMCDQIAQLGKLLEKFMGELDALKTPYVVVLTADHGSADAAERVSERGIEARRIVPETLLSEINESVKAELGLSFLPLGGEAQNIYVTHKDVDAALREKIVATTLSVLRKREEVYAAFTQEEVLAAKIDPRTPVDELSLLERFAESIDVERGADILVALKPDATFYNPKAPDNFIAGHGSPWTYDRQVPIVFYWPGVRHFEQYLAVETVDIAPTLAALAHVPTPQLDGRCIDVDASAETTCRATLPQ